MIAFPQSQTVLDHDRAIAPGYWPQIADVPSRPPGYEIHKGHLIQRGLDMFALATNPVWVDGRLERPATPMYVRRVAMLRENYAMLRGWFEAAKRKVGYPGDALVAYASKANPSEPVVRTLLQAGAAYECSSASDVQIVRRAAAQGWLDRGRQIFANGFKIPAYASGLIRLRTEGFENILPIFDDLEEIEPFAASGLPFEVGLRSRTDSDALNRFGMSMDDLFTAAERIAASGNLHLTTYHAMQTVSAGRGLQYQVALMHSLRRYAELRREIPTLRRFNFGGGLPARSSGLDFADWMEMTLRTVLSVCAEEAIPAPDLIFETGRYMAQDHASRLFRVVKTRMGADGIPYYMIDGSIMSSFPDAWALGDAFTVLPVNHWDGPFQPVRLAGLTCDQDDVYPTRKMDDVPLMMPVDTNGLVIGFFDCGAYQETLGGRLGAKHCLLPEGAEMILDEDTDADQPDLTYDPGQTAEQILGQLGYG